MMLWSGNCRPPAEAIRMTRELGLGNMNGGETVVSRRLPGLAGVSPRTAIWDGEVQVYAANQNEYVYTGEWRGPLYGGFQKVIDTFERTEEPRRLKPVNIYYHFYSAVYFGSLRALSNVYSWCRKQPLHAVTARQYVDLVTDSRATRFFRLGDRRWLALNDGHLRTFRLPARLGDPDMRASRGLTGFARHGEWNYLHTNGARRVEIALLGSRALASASRHLRLVDSSAEIAFDRLEADWAEFKVRDLRPAALRFGGVEPGSSWSLIADTPSPSRLSADENGQLSFTLPANSEARLERLPRTASK